MKLYCRKCKSIIRRLKTDKNINKPFVCLKCNLSLMASETITGEKLKKLIEARDDKELEESLTTEDLENARETLLNSMEQALVGDSTYDYGNGTGGTWTNINTLDNE